MPRQPVTPAAETVVARLRPHGRVLFWPTVALLAICGATGFFAWRFTEQWAQWAVLAAAALLAILFWALPLLSWLGRVYTITTRRLVIRHGVFVRFRQEILHSRGYDVTVRKNGLQALFRSGDVRINTGLQHPIVLRDVPNADLVQAALHEVMEQSANPIAARRQQEQSRGHDDTQMWG